MPSNRIDPPSNPVPIDPTESHAMKVATLKFVESLHNIICLNEHWLNEEELQVFHISDFTSAAHYCRPNKERGGVYIYIKNNLNYIEDKETETERKSLLLASYLNSTLCQLKLKDYFEAKNSATSALKLDPENEKAYFRRGQAFLNLGEPQFAHEDFKKCLEIDPNNSAAKSQLAVCGKKLKEQLQMEKKIYANMFDKFAKTDTQVKAN